MEDDPRSQAIMLQPKKVDKKKTLILINTVYYVKNVEAEQMGSLPAVTMGEAISLM